MSFRKRGYVVVSVLILIFVVAACGPAAPAADNGGEDKATVEPTPTVGPGAADDKADADQKPTAVPPPTPKPPEPTKPAEPTSPSQERDPDDPPSPTDEPKPTPAVDATPDPASSILNSGLPHPRGLDGCRSMNIFTIPHEEFKFIAWCTTAVMEDVADACRGTGEGTEDEKQCAISRVADVPAYTLRELLTPCVGITDEDDYAQCYEQSFIAWGQHAIAFNSVWNEILLATVDDANVKFAFASLASCVRDAGYEPPDADSPLPWQEKDEARAEANRTNKRTIIDDTERLRVIDQCALSSRFYEAQEEKWISEIERLMASDPERVRPLLQEGVDDALNAPGVPAFLTIRQFASNR